MESLKVDGVRELADLRRSYEGLSVFVSGHTGFKGSWLTTCLASLGAEVTGYALPPNTNPSLFVASDVALSCRHKVGDVRNRRALRSAVAAAKPSIAFHLAAQPLVRRSYREPVETIETNVLGTANLLEAIRAEGRPCAVVVVTSDKCYENDGAGRDYAEVDPLGGHDVYSASKAAAEIVAASYRRSFFDPRRLAEHGVAVATARAGNVIGDNDWAEDRLVPDAVRSLAAGRPIVVRNPRAVRPWQHVLEPLSGYFTLGMRLLGGSEAERSSFCEAWNFGPRPEDAVPVAEVVARLIDEWGGGTWEDRGEPTAPHEARHLSLAIGKARERLRWAPRWGLTKAVQRTTGWYRTHLEGAGSAELRALCVAQFEEFLTAGRSV